MFGEHYTQIRGEISDVVMPYIASVALMLTIRRLDAESATLNPTGTADSTLLWNFEGFQHMALNLKLHTRQLLLGAVRLYLSSAVRSSYSE